MDVNNFQVIIIVISPNIPQQLFSGKDHTPIFCKGRKEVEFDGRQLNFILT